MNYVVIPARWSSSRLPGKPLKKIGSKPMIQWVYESCRKSDADFIFIATDSEKIRDQVLEFNGQVIMTSVDHKTGTDRIHEAITKINCHEEDLIINVQGDEPFISHDDINTLIRNYNDHFEMATLYKELKKEDIDDTNAVNRCFSQNIQVLILNLVQKVRKILISQEMIVFSVTIHETIHHVSNG